MGKIKVDFAGTHKEAEQFVQENKDKFPNKSLSKSDEVSPGESFPIVEGNYKNDMEKQWVSEGFESLGWDKDSQITCD